MTRQRIKRNTKIQKRFRLHALRIHPFCRWCQCPLTEGSATTDHLVPLSRGGSNDWGNLCLACLPCNRERKDRLPHEVPGAPAERSSHRPEQAEGRRRWAAWTRYPGGRWRVTLLGRCPDQLWSRTQKLVGTTAETVILPEGEGPADPAGAEGGRLKLPKGYHCGAGGLISIAEDYFRFAQMLANGGELNGKRLLSPRSVELMSTNHVGEMFGGQLGRPRGMGFGLTVEVVTDPARAGTYRSAGSFGWDGAFGTHFWVDPRAELVGVLLMQAPAGPVVRGIQSDFETAAMQALTDLGPEGKRAGTAK